MAKLTKFSINSEGNLVYRTSGRRARGTLTLKGTTVYRNGIRIGTVSKQSDAGTKRKLQKLDEKISKTSSAKLKARWRKQKKEIQRKQREAYQKARKEGTTSWTNGRSEDAIIVFGGDDFGFGDDDFGEGGVGIDYSDDFVIAFAELVKESMHRDLPQWLKNRINALDPFDIFNAYQAKMYVFDVYFQYNPDGSLYGADNAARWMVSIVEQLEKQWVKSE